MNELNDSIPAVPADTLAAPTDSVTVAPARMGILLTPPERAEAHHVTGQSTGMSVIIGLLTLLFCIIALRFRNNRKYINSLLRDLVEVKARHNVFDETVRETTFLWMLNLLWSLSAGIILWGILEYSPYFPGVAEILHLHRPETIGVCMLCMLAYTGFMSVAYLTVGTVFADATQAKMWLKGFTSAQGLLSFIFFPLSLVLLFYPQWAEIILWIAVYLFIGGKAVFIWKGFRIFFNQSSSWVLFLYYLCSLEIVPLILTCLGARTLCSFIPQAFS